MNRTKRLNAPGFDSTGLYKAGVNAPLVPARKQVLSLEKKVPISDWLGGLQTTPRKTRKGFVKPPLYLLALALLALTLAQRTNGERLTYGNRKENM